MGKLTDHLTNELLKQIFKPFEETETVISDNNRTVHFWNNTNLNPEDKIHISFLDKDGNLHDGRLPEHWVTPQFESGDCPLCEIGNKSKEFQPPIQYDIPCIEGQTPDDMKLNKCVPGNPSTCGVDGTTWKSHNEKCRFAEQAEHANRCTFYTFDKFCTCLKAQQEAQK